MKNKKGYFEESNTDIVKKVKRAYRRNQEQLIKTIHECNLSDSAKNNPGLQVMIDNPRTLIDGKEKNRWIREISLLATRLEPGARILNIGSAIPVAELILNELGYHVETIEKVDLYGKGYRPLIELAEKNGIKFHNIDILYEPFENMLPQKYDAIMLLAVVEHLFVGPEYLLKKIHKLLSPNGILLLDTPNGAGMSSRLIYFLKGTNPELAYHHFNNAQPPYTGHITCFSPEQIRRSIINTGFDIRVFFTKPRNPNDRDKFSFVLKIIEKALSAVKYVTKSSYIESTAPELWERDIICIARKSESAE